MICVFVSKWDLKLHSVVPLLSRTPRPRLKNYSSRDIVALARSRLYYVCPATPEWRNWYTHQTQNLARSNSCRFESDLRHQPKTQFNQVALLQVRLLTSSFSVTDQRALLVDFYPHLLILITGTKLASDVFSPRPRACGGSLAFMPEPPSLNLNQMAPRKVDLPRGLVTSKCFRTKPLQSPITSTDWWVQF